MSKWNVDSDFDEKVIIPAIGDPEKWAIIKTVFDSPKTFKAIIAECNLPNTSSYRKLNQMIEDGLLVKNGFVTSRHGRKAPKYQTSFDDVTIIIKMRKKS